MEENRRHSTAVIHKATRLHEDVTVGAYAVIEDGVEIQEGTIIREHAIIRSGSMIGHGCIIDSHAVVGGLPQDLTFHPATPSGVRIGDQVVLREGVTISRASKEGQFTEVGDGCYLMANSHIGHDCRLGSKVIMANGVLLGGLVTVGDRAFFGGNAAVHQNIRIGETAMVGGMGRVSMDVPPFCMMAERNELVGINLVGLQRMGLERAEIREIKKLYQTVLCVAGRPRHLAEAALKDGLAATAEGRRFLEFISAESKKGVMRVMNPGT